MGRRIGGADKVDNSKCHRALEAVRRSPISSRARGPPSVFSEELLALARPRVVKRLVDSLAPRRVVVVVTVRDLGAGAGLLLAADGDDGPHRYTSIEFLRWGPGPPSPGAASAGVGFWMRQDVVLDPERLGVGRPARRHPGGHPAR